MVQTIAISLMSRLPEWEKEERLKFASEILQDIEIEGMLPPQRMVTGKEAFTIGRSYGKRGNISNLIQNSWEPEDD